jgi:hypothetical protein
MPNIDIAVDADLTQLFQLPSCDALALPDAGKISVQLPTGGVLQSFSDISKGIPTDCSMTFSLMMQIAPFLASIQCLLNVLKLLKPLIDIIKSLPGIPPVKAIEEFGEAVVALAPCLLIPTPAAMIPFVKDLLCLILKVLKCFLSQMQSLLRILGPLSLQLNLAQQSGNDELVSTLQCAQQNAQTQAGQIMNSLGPAGVLLDLAGPLFGIAGIPAISLPSLGSASDLQSLNTAVKSIQEVVGVIQIAVDALGGCDS